MSWVPAWPRIPGGCRDGALCRERGEEKEIPAFGLDSIEMAMRLRIRETIEELLHQELDTAHQGPLGAATARRSDVEHS